MDLNQGTSNESHIPVIVLNWNGYQDTVKSINSIFRQTHENYSIILMDNHSSNNEGERLAQKFERKEKVIVQLHDTNLGFAKAHNWAFDYCLQNHPESKYLALLNNDAFAESNWLSELVDFAEKHSCDMVSSKMLNFYERNKMDNSGHMMLNTGEIIPIGHGLPKDQFNKAKQNLGPCAGACLISLSLLREIGIYDNFFNTGYEDAEMGLRANILGYNTMYCPEAVVYHKGSVSINKIKNYNYVLRIQVNIIYTYMKLLPLTVILINLPFLLFKFLAMIVIDVLFWRPSYLRLIWESWWHILSKHRKIIFIKRKEFYKRNGHQIISNLEVQRKMTFFLLFDILRFWKYFILQSPSALDLDRATDSKDS